MSSLPVRWGRRLEASWYQEGEALCWLRPLAGAFSAAARLRRAAYVNGWKPVERLPVPVIVVGNLTVGGTGKTPLTLWLVDFLRGAGYRPGVVSRGYGGIRDSDQPLFVTSETDPSAAGDEPVLIAGRTGAPVMVAADRAAAGRALLASGAADLIIADDGLQHYRLGRDLEILLIDGQRNLGNGYCLPAGPLREPPDRIDSVDFVVRRGAPPAAGEYGMSLTGLHAVNLVSGERVPLARFAREPVHALAGIANPGSFFRHLEAAGLLVATRAFPDHHRFRPEDLDSGDSSPVLMTEKDAVKCRSFATGRHWCVPVDANLTPTFGPDLLQRLRAKFHG